MEAGSQHHIFLLAVFMLLFGTLNTIANKFQDLTVVGRKEDGTPIYFQHPGFQSACMFLGELMCLGFFYASSLFSKCSSSSSKTQLVSLEFEEYSSMRKTLAFLIPASCDAIGTTLLYVGLFYTYASSFQMLRGSVVFFSGILTILMLKRRLYSHHWAGMFLIVLGTACVGVASVLTQTAAKPDDPDSTPGAPAPLLGNILVVCAQIAAAFQFIIEEKGFWGLLICGVALPILGWAKDNDPFLDIKIAFRETLESKQLMLSTIGSIVSIAFFNFFGLSVTRHLSGAARATIDACRTLFIWLFALQVGWERFHGLEVIGFLSMILGTCIYNRVIDLQNIIISSNNKERNGEALTLEETKPILGHPSRSQDSSFIPIGATKGGNSSMRYMMRSFRLGGWLGGSSSSTQGSIGVLGRGGSPTTPLSTGNSFFGSSTLSRSARQNYDSLVISDSDTDMIDD